MTTRNKINRGICACLILNAQLINSVFRYMTIRKESTQFVELRPLPPLWTSPDIGTFLFCVPTLRTLFPALFTLCVYASVCAQACVPACVRVSVLVKFVVCVVVYIYICACVCVEAWGQLWVSFIFNEFLRNSILLGPGNHQLGLTVCFIQLHLFHHFPTLRLQDYATMLSF